MRSSNNDEKKQPVLVRLTPQLHQQLITRAAEETIRRKKVINMQTLIVEAIVEKLNQSETSAKASV